jgi:TRAP transporter TAXI family solute receptor
MVKIAPIMGLLLFFCVPVKADDERSYLLSTATTGGTYYPVGVALATLAKVKLQPIHDINISAINSAGSAENIRLMRDGEASFAILMGLFGHYARTGTGPLEAYGPQDHLRSVSFLWMNVEQWIMREADIRSGTVTDLALLRGSHVALGKKNSGSIQSNRHLLGNLGLQIDQDFRLFFGGYGPSASAMQDGRVAAISTPAGVPTSAVTKLFAANKGEVRLLSVTPEQAGMADGGVGLWAPYIIPAETYPGQATQVATIAQPNFLAVHENVDSEVVYLLTRTIYENLDFLHAIHNATREMSLEKAAGGLPVPLHPGAERYYREAGLLKAVQD